MAIWQWGREGVENGHFDMSFSFSELIDVTCGHPQHVKFHESYKTAPSHQM